MEEINVHCVFNFFIVFVSRCWSGFDTSQLSPTGE